MSSHTIDYIINLPPFIYVSKGVTKEINFNSQFLRDPKIIDSK